MRVFVAGSGGYIGLALCDELLRRGHEVEGFDRYYFGRLPVGCKVTYGDIRTVEKIDADAVVDLAGLSNDAAGDIDESLTWSINYLGAVHLALVAKRCGIKRYIYSSSASVYGNNTRLGLTDMDECKPLTLYAESKVRVEDFLRGSEGDDFNVIILRNATVFGVSKRMRFDLVVNGMTRSAWLYKKVTIDGHGWQWRPFIHIDDLVKAFADRLEWQGSFTENIVSHNQMIGQLAREIASAKRCAIIQNPEGVDRRSYNLKPTIVNGKTTMDGIEEVWAGLESGNIDAHDPTAWTVKWYRSMPELKLRLAA